MIGEHILACKAPYLSSRDSPKHLLRRDFKVVVQLADCREICSFAARFCAQLLASFGALPSELQLPLLFIVPMRKDCSNR